MVIIYKFRYCSSRIFKIFSRPGFEPHLAAINPAGPLNPPYLHRAAKVW